MALCSVVAASADPLHAPGARHVRAVLHSATLPELAFQADTFHCSRLITHVLPADGVKGQTRADLPITAVDRTYSPLQVLRQSLQPLCILNVAGSMKPQDSLQHALHDDCSFAMNMLHFTQEIILLSFLASKAGGLYIPVQALAVAPLALHTHLEPTHVNAHQGDRSFEVCKGARRTHLFI